MNVIEGAIPGLLIIEPKVFDDTRGSFLELFNKERYARHGPVRSFVQDNLSRSAKGVLRGLHFQNPNSQGKLVTVLHGCVLDVSVDVRVGSPTFGRHVAIELNDESRRQIWIPRGLAHGFVVRSKSAHFFYKCDEYYRPSDEIVLRWDDNALGIDWGESTPLVSKRDAEGRALADLGALLPRYR